MLPCLLMLSPPLVLPAQAYGKGLCRAICSSLPSLYCRVLLSPALSTFYQDVNRPGEVSCKHACGYLLISPMVGTFSALQVPGTAA